MFQMKDKGIHICCWGSIGDFRFSVELIAVLDG